MKNWEVSLLTIIILSTAGIIAWGVWAYITLPWTGTNGISSYNQHSNAITINTRNIPITNLETINIIIKTDQKIIIEK